MQDHIREREENMKIGVIGLGKLGLCLAAVLGNHFEVIGIDKNKELVERINKKERGILPEPGLDEMIERANLSAYTENYRLRGCEIIFCIVPTPSLKDGEFTDRFIRRAIKEAKLFMKECKVFNIVSTVMPGTCERLQKLFPRGTIISYNPEFIALGDVISGMIHPDFVLIGTEKIGPERVLKWIYSMITNAPVICMDLKSAEIAKISLNAYVTMKISFANVLGEIAEKYGADVDKITRALGCDRRIGHLYFKAGSAYGGLCFPRDNRAFSKIAGEIPNYADATDFINSHQTERILKKIGKIKGKRISIIGMSYKNGTPITEESEGEVLARKLEEEGAIVLQDALCDTDMAIFMLPRTEVSLMYHQEAKEKKIKIIDLWRDKGGKNG